MGKTFAIVQESFDQDDKEETYKTFQQIERLVHEYGGRLIEERQEAMF